MSKGFRYWGKESQEKFDLIELSQAQHNITIYNLEGGYKNFLKTSTK